MSAIAVAFILVCGFIYTDKHLPARYKQKRATGWESYCHVALHGFKFCSIGFLLVALIYLLLWLLSSLYNLPAELSWGSYKLVAWNKSFLHLHFEELSIPLILSMLFGFLIAIGEANKSVKQQQDPSCRLKVYASIAGGDRMESLFLDSMMREMPVRITLKSRKVYVGMAECAVQQDQFDSDFVVIIPLSSGYRDKDTLAYHDTHNYAEYYQHHQITLDSKPLSLRDFRMVIDRSQIETVSLFDTATYHSFSLDEAHDTNL